MSALVGLIALSIAVPTTMVAAAAGPPPNDNRADAIRLGLPASTTGTLLGATNESGKDRSACAESAASVWYRFRAPARGTVVVELDNAGDMDGSVDIVRQERSRLISVGCQATDKKGIATLEVSGLASGADYFVRIGRDEGSTQDNFALRVLVPSPPPTPPGRSLPPGGARNVVDRLVDPGDAWNSRLEAGRTMRLALASERCLSLRVFAPGVRSFDRAEPFLSVGCSGYRLFTPRESGRYVFLVEAERGRGAQKYRLRVAAADRDDTAPGVPLGDRAKVTGRLNGRIDSVDLYRFQVNRRSAVKLRVTGGETRLELRRDGGRFLGGGTTVEERLRRGRYYVAVEGDGRYTLTRTSRLITRTTVRFDGRTKTVGLPGETSTVELRVSPGQTGRGEVLIERSDPLSGWQFVRRVRMRVVDGSARFGFQPAGLGRYRASGVFAGTRAAAPSESGYARLRVREPLR